MALSESELIKFEALLDGYIWRSEVARATNKLKQLIQLHLSKSLYFKRFFLRVIEKYPAYLQCLDDTVQLGHIAKGLLGVIENLPTFEEKRRTLADYYDLEYLRVGLNTLQGTNIRVTNAEFTEFSDSYLQTLFEVCKQRIDDEIGRKVATRDLLAIFVAGGHAREQAYDDDYDLLILLNSTDQEMRAYCNRIVTRMNADLLKRGTLPHYRFADHFGHYVTLMQELEQYFSRDHPDCFIDKSQILGSRMIIGSTKFDKEFEERIIRPHIFDDSDRYISRMIAELESRHGDQARTGHGQIDLKEGIGGLRDIEMILLMYKARYRRREPINRRLIQTLSELDPKHRDDFEVLSEALDFFKSVRDLYRLTVSAEDELRPEFLERTARILGFEASEARSATDSLLGTYHARAARTAEIVERLTAEMRTEAHVTSF
jgi:UTP:GlnB (protein PII) uridylyltransferase